MIRLSRALLAVGAMTALACGTATAQESLPPASQEGPPPAPTLIAQVGTAPIFKSDFDKWFAQAAHSQLGRTVELVPTRYADCVTAMRAQRKKRGWRKLSKPALRARCARTHRMVRRQVVQFLVQSQWVEQEAERQGIGVSDQRVERLFRSQKRQAFPNERGYRRFLRESGSQEPDIKQRIRLDALQNRLTRLVTSRVAPVTRREVTRFRVNHRKRFAGVPPAKANRRIHRLLVSVREQRALGRFIERFRKRYVSITWCARAYGTSECGAIQPQAVEDTPLAPPPA